VYTKAVAVKTLVVELQHSAISLAQFKPYRVRIGPSKRVGLRLWGGWDFGSRGTSRKKLLVQASHLLPSSVKSWR
jgi:hypothetical protein